MSFNPRFIYLFILPLLVYFLYNCGVIQSMIFFPDKTFYEKPQDFGYAFEDVRLKTKDGVSLHGWYLEKDTQKKSKATILFFHGNAGNISNRLEKVKGWIDRGVDVFLVDYRGYGKSEGAISKGDDILKDAAAAFDWLLHEKKIPLERIVLYGESLGTYPAIKLATEHRAAALILEAPFTSFLDLAKEHYPYVPPMVIGSFSFPNAEHIEKIKSPLFILHGMRDEICPYAMAGELFEKAPEPKGFLSIPDGMHNDLPVSAGDDYWEKPYEFVSKYL